MVGSSKHKCRFKKDDKGNLITENGKKILQCKVDGQGPVEAHPTPSGGFNFVPTGDIDDKKEKKAIKYMKRRLQNADTEGKSGEW